MTHAVFWVCISFFLFNLLAWVWDTFGLGDYLRFRFNMWKCWHRFRR